MILTTTMDSKQRNTYSEYDSNLIIGILNRRISAKCEVSSNCVHQRHNSIISSDPSRESQHFQLIECLFTGFVVNEFDPHHPQ
jgi:hypothetical protein